MLARLFCIAFLAWPACGWARDTGARSNGNRAKLAERTKTEARAVLAAVLRDTRVESTPCLFDTEWSDSPIDAVTARRYLLSTRKVDVVASHPEVSPSALIGADDSTGSAFCSEADANALWLRMRDAFRSGADPGQCDTYQGRPIGSPRVSMTRVQLTMPVFDRAFATAAVIVGYSGRRISKGDADAISREPRLYDEAGYPRREAIEGFGYT